MSFDSKPQAAPSQYNYDLYSEWPFFADENKLKVYNPAGNVGIVIGRIRMPREDENGGTKAIVDPPLAVILEDLPEDFPLEHIAAIGTVWTLKLGIERIVQNVLTNPHINTLILCGRDSGVFYPLRGLLCLTKYGTDEGRHVVGEGLPERCRKVFMRDALVSLSQKDIDFFRHKRRIQMIDMIDKASNPREIFSDIARLLPKVGRKVDSPSYRFLSELDIYSWKPKTIQAKAGQPNYEHPTHDYAISYNDSTEQVLLSCYRKDGASHATSTVLVVGDNSRDRAAQGMMHIVAEKKIFPGYPDWEFFLSALTCEVELMSLSRKYPEYAQRLKTDYQQHHIGLSERLDIPSIKELTGKVGKIHLDPKGYFTTSVLYEEGKIRAVYMDNATSQEVIVKGTDAKTILETILEGDYVGKYSHRLQHIIYLSIQLIRADFALRTGLSFQDDKPLSDSHLRNIETRLNAAVHLEAGTLEEGWIKWLQNLLDDGLITRTLKKGRVVENWATLLHLSNIGEMEIPQSYQSMATEEHIENYAAELLKPKPTDSNEEYTYGDRECHYFYNQIADVSAKLSRTPHRAYITQRFDPVIDLEQEHGPCLAFDVWFIQNGHLCTFQVVRSHDIYGGMPENALGIARGWAKKLGTQIDLPLGDLVFLSISNNYRVGDDAENVRRTINRGISTRKTFAPKMNPLFVCHLDTPDEVANQLNEYAASASPGMHFVGFYTKHPFSRQLIDIELIEKTITGKNELGWRLRNYQGKDILSLAVEHLKSRMRENRTPQQGQDRTNRCVITPRDPRVDRDEEISTVLCIQLREQLGVLHAAGVFVNASAKDFGEHFSTVFGIQQHVSEAIGIPQGTIYLQYAPLLVETAD